MKKLYAILIAIALVSLTAVACAQVKTSSTTPENRQEQCKAYASAQYKAIRPAPVSGTTLNYTYDAKSGFCTVKVENKNPNNSFYSETSTNVLDSSPTAVIFQTDVEPVHIVWKPAPRHLLCEKVVTQKNGQQLCTPAKQSEDDFFNPFWPLQE